MLTANSRATTRHAAILIEVVVALAIFIAAAGLTLGIGRNVLDAMARAAIEQEAVDVVASRMAELEAGLLEITELRDGELDDRWVFDVDTERTEWTGLTLVTLTARPLDPGSPVSVTLRQLVRLRDTEADAYELDEMLEGLE